MIRCAWLYSVALLMVGLCVRTQAALPLEQDQPRLRLVPQTNSFIMVDIEESADGSRLLTHSRQFAPQLWDGKTLRLLAVLGGAQDRVLAVRLSRDGKQALTMGMEETRIWDATRARQISRFPAGDGEFFVDAQFSPDGRRFAVCSSDGDLYVVDAATGKRLHAMKSEQTYVGWVDWSGDGKKLVMGSGDTAVVWTPETDNKVKLASPKMALVRSLDINESGTLVVASNWVDGATVFDATTGKEKFTLPNAIGDRTEALRAYVGAMFVMPNDSSILYCERGGDMVLVDPTTGKEQRRLKGHTAPVDEFRLNRSKTRLGTHGDDERVLMWDLVSGAQTPLNLKSDDMPTAAAFGANQDECWVGFMNGELRKYDLRTGGVKSGTLGATTSLARIRFLGSNRLLAIGRNSTGSLFIDNLAESKIIVLPQRRQDDSLYAYAYELFSDSGRYNLADQGGNIFQTPIKFIGFDLWSNKSLFETKSDQGQIGEFVPNSDFAMMVLADGTVIGYDFSQQKEVLNVQFPEAQPGFTGAISPDARFAVHGPYSQSKTFSVWDIDSREIKCTLQGAESLGIGALKFSPDGRIIAGAGREKAAWWDAQTGSLISTAPHGVEAISFAQYPIQIRFSRDGSHFMIWRGSQVAAIKIEDSQSFQHNFTSSIVEDVDQRFSANADKFLSWQGNKVYITETTTKKVIHRFELNDTALCAIFSPDEKRILTADLIDGIVIWDATTFKRLGSMVQMRDGTWLVMDTEGRYDANDPDEVRGALYVYEWEGGLEPLEVSQFKGYFWDPGLLEKLLGTHKEPKRDVPDLKSLHLYPTIKLSANQRGAVDIELEERDNGGIGTVIVSLNGKEVLRKIGTGYFRVDADDLKPFLLPENRLEPGKGNLISVRASNADGTLTSLPVTLDLGIPKGLQAPDVKLYALCVGAGDYVGTTRDLAAPPNDATDLAKAIRRVAGGFLANRVEITELTTTEKEGQARPTRNNILRWFDEVSKKATSSDIVMVFFAGHGMDKLGSKSGYFFLTSEADPNSLSEANIGQVSISGEDLQTRLKAVAANKQIVILDTCHSGAAASNVVGLERSVSGDYQRAWDSIRQATGTWMLAGAAADQLSYESPNVDHGMLTYALLEAIDKANSDGLRPGQSGELFVDVERWLNYAANRVESLKNEVGLPGIQRPQFKRAANGSSFDIGVLNEKDRGAVGLKPPVPVVILGPFEQDQEDPENLEEAIRAVMAESSAVKAWADVAKHPNVYRIAGTYTVENRQVTVKVFIQKFDATQKRTTLKTVEVLGAVGKPQAIAKGIREVVEKEIQALELAKSTPAKP
ncbi:MAG: caspase family protein [Chthonomonas sp.]|nr:caspase family protein [Chthonomonas sp.]